MTKKDIIKEMKFILDKLFKRTQGFYPFFKYCPRRYWEYYISKRASMTLGYDYNYKEPKSLNEKIRWLIYNENLELKTQLADKILVKDYVSSKLGNNYYAKLYGTYNNINEIDFSILPNSFALKANHGWSMNIFVPNKNLILKNYKEIKKITNQWLKINYEEYSAEPQYKNIKRKLLIEKLRSASKEHFRNELMVHCFNGEPILFEEKHIKDDKIYFQFYDKNWQLQNFTHTFDFLNEKLDEPEDLNKIIEYCRILSKDISYVRIDVTYDEGNIHIVEMTFTPCSAIIPFDSKETDFELGKLLKI